MLTEPETFDINLFSASTTSIENDPLAARENCFKRRKIDELTYAASRVKEDIEKGGLAFPLNHTDKPRALEGTDIDMSSIRLLGAKSVADSPFLNPICGNKRSFQSTTYDFEQLFSETQRAYSKRWIQDVQTDWGDRSSVGSLTSDSECSLSLDIPPRLEDGLNRASATDSCSEETSPALNTVQMSTALENTSEPR